MANSCPTTVHVVREKKSWMFQNDSGQWVLRIASRGCADGRWVANRPLLSEGSDIPKRFVHLKSASDFRPLLVVIILSMSKFSYVVGWMAGVDH